MNALIRAFLAFSALGWLAKLYGAETVSLALEDKGANGLLLTARAPEGERYALQASPDLRRWVDLKDEVRGELLVPYEPQGASARYFRLVPWSPPASNITVALIGDSTVADFVNDDGRFSGWGQGFYHYFKDEATVVNLAYPCYSTKIFLESAELNKLLIIKPDYVLVQFGLIDFGGCGEGQIADYATSIQEYQTNLEQIVRLVRGFNGTPILVTPPNKWLFDAQGQVMQYLYNHATVTRQVAAEMHTPLIDLTQMSLELVNRLGKSGSAYLMYPGDTSNCHYSETGSLVIAGLVVNAMPESIWPYLRNLNDYSLKP